MSLAPNDPIQNWLDQHRRGENPCPHILCNLCMDRVKVLVRPRLKGFPQVELDAQTTEILDDTLLRLIKALPAVQPANVVEFDRYIATIIRRVLLDRQKALNSRQRTLERFKSLLPPEPLDTGYAFSLEEMEAFHKYVAELPDESRAYFDLLYYRNLTTAQAAERLGLHLSTLKQRWTKFRYESARVLGRDFTQFPE